MYQQQKRTAMDRFSDVKIGMTS